jgi:hypothetical protein
MRNYLLIAIMALATFAVADQTMAVDKEGAMPKGCAMGGMGMMGGMGNMMNTDPDKAKQEMGDLYYPGSTIVHSGICYMMETEGVMAVLSTTDSLDKVAAYYAGKFSGNDVTTSKGPGFQNWMHPGRTNGNTMVPPVKVHAMQTYSGKEVMIKVMMGDCAMGKNMGGMMGGKGMKGGPGMMGGGMMEGDEK